MIWRCSTCGARWADATECGMCATRQLGDAVWSEPPPGLSGTSAYEAWLGRVAERQQAWREALHAAAHCPGETST